MCNKNCANCGLDLYYEKVTGNSSLYFPNGFSILLCENCFETEDELINKDGNNHPELLAKYLRNIGK